MTRFHRTVLLTVVAMLTTILPAESFAFDVVVDGKPMSAIVIADKPLPVVEYAAREFQHHVREASGAELPILRESAAPKDGNRIYLGRCRAADEAGITSEGLSPNAFRGKIDGAGLYIVGRDNWGFSSVDARGVSIGRIQHNGTLFGVYTFLAEKMNVKWLWPGRIGEVIPSARTIRIASWDVTWKPPLRHARLRTHYGPVRFEDGWAKRENMFQFRVDQTAWMLRHRMGNEVSLEYNHAWGNYWNKYGQTRREWFPMMPNGERGLDPIYKNYFPMCISSPSFHEHVIEEWKKRRTAERPWVNGCENDSGGKCICETCRSWDVPAPGDEVSMAKLQEQFDRGEGGWERWMGSLTDRYCRFYLTLQEMARETDPDATVIVLAYENYAKPPVKAKLNRNIVVSLVPGMMYPWTDDGREAFRDQWQGWSDAGASLYLRPNYSLDGHAMPIFYAHKFGEDFAFAFKRGMIATDFDSLTGQYATQGPTLYMKVRMQVDGDVPPQEILDDFYGGFGPASEQIRAYFDHWREVSDAVTHEKLRKAIREELDGDGGGWPEFYKTAPVIFRPNVMRRGSELLAVAERAARDEERTAEKVAFLRHGLTNVEQILETQAAYRGYKKSGEPYEFVAALRRLDRFRAKHEHLWIANMGYLRWSEDRHWDRNLVDVHRAENQALPTKWKFMWDPRDKGVRDEWYADDFNTDAWHEIATTSHWEKQPIGKKWKQKHGRNYDGFAWYRNAFEVERSDDEAKYMLYFGAVDEACTVWINGRKVLVRPFPFEENMNSWMEPFEIDVTDALRFDGINTVAVRVEDNRGGGGIWRSVYIAERR
ncbi:MAG: hypothetical protein CMJ18_02575 [Phycisphaeraceae bacterium]|nr:hypothetical protein [Phycisphaeraceae bacterium]